MDARKSSASQHVMLVYICTYVCTVIVYYVLSCCYNILFVLFNYGFNEMCPNKFPRVLTPRESAAQRVDGNLNGCGPPVLDLELPQLWGATLVAQF
jgi:hypothetical protein